MVKVFTVKYWHPLGTINYCVQFLFFNKVQLNTSQPPIFIRVYILLVGPHYRVREGTLIYDKTHTHSLTHSSPVVNDTDMKMQGQSGVSYLGDSTTDALWHVNPPTFWNNYYDDQDTALYKQWVYSG